MSDSNVNDHVEPKASNFTLMYGSLNYIGSLNVDVPITQIIKTTVREYVSKTRNHDCRVDSLTLVYLGDDYAVVSVITSFSQFPYNYELTLIDRRPLVVSRYKLCLTK